MPTKAEQRERTREEILRIATRRFAESGYAGVALEDLVAEAGLTRGALYHHFGSKHGLFAAVVERAQFAVAEAVERAAAADAAPLEAFLAGCRAFLEASLGSEVRRILHVDGPRSSAGATGATATSNPARLLDAGVAELAEAGVIAPRSLDTVTMISGALNEVAIANASARDPQRGIDEAVDTLARLLAGLAPASDSGIAQPPAP